MKRVAAIAGMGIRYDVPTKCHAVAIVLKQKFPSKADQDDFIKEVSTMLGVNPMTIKSWISKYHNTYHLGMSLPTGTMSHSFVVLEDAAIPKAKDKLIKLREKLVALRREYETSTVADIAASDLRSTKTPKEILEELIVNTIAD